MKYFTYILFLIVGILIGAGLTTSKASAGSSTKKFEYEYADAPTVKTLVTKLNTMGSQGWDVASQVGVNGALIMKREIQ